MPTSEVTIKVTVSEHHILTSLLRYQAKKITEEQFRAILVTLGYKDLPVTVYSLGYLAEQTLLAIGK